MSFNFIFFMFGAISSGVTGACLLLKWHMDGHQTHDLAWATAILSFAAGTIFAASQYDLESPSAGIFAVLLFWIFAAAMIVGTLSFRGQNVNQTILAACFLLALVLSFGLRLHHAHSMVVFTTVAAAIFIWTGWELRSIPFIGWLAALVFGLRGTFLLARPFLPAGEERALLALSSNAITLSAGLILLMGSVLRSHQLQLRHEQALAEANSALEQQADHLRILYEATSNALHRAEGAIQAKRRFIANMSHELRTPLNAVIGYSELISQRVGEADAKTLRNYADAAKDGGVEILGKISRILNYIEIDEQHCPAAEPFDPSEAVTAEVDRLRERLEAKELNVVCEIAAPPWPLQGGAATFGSIVGELLDNAVKAAPAGSSISIELTKRNSVSCLRISDRGPGIPEDFRRTIGESFNVDGDVYERGGDAQGLGLGLSLVARYARQIGAELAVKPNNPTGTVAEVSFSHEKP